MGGTSSVCPLALAVDSAWLRHRFTRQEKEQARVADLYRWKPFLIHDRHVNIITGRAVRVDGSCRIFGYINKEITSAVTRLDHFLSEQGIAKDQKIIVVSDGAREFEKAADGSKRPLNHILDWFHIAMKFRAIEQSAWKFPHLPAPSGRPVADEIASAKWLTWDGKSDTVVERLKSLHDMLDLPPSDPAHQALCWNLRGTYFI